MSGLADIDSQSCYLHRLQVAASVGQAHPMTYKAMLLGESFGEGLLTKAAEADCARVLISFDVLVTSGYNI